MIGKKFFSFILLFIMFSGLGIFFLYQGMNTPSLKKDLTFEVKPGEGVSAVAHELYSQGALRSPLLFKVWGRWIEPHHAPRVGEYEIHEGTSPLEILRILSSGKSKAYKMTFPEGINIFEMSQIFQERGLATSEEFLSLVRDTSWSQELMGQPYDSLEGYLYPETYTYTKYTRPKDIILQMVEHFKNIFSKISSHYHGPLSPRQIVILASMIEKETGAPFERRHISSVFYNRLKKGMRLQSDPTTIYGRWIETGQFLKNIRHKDLTHPTDYNTYTLKGLPTGPICNPGEEALRAAMNPESTEDLYFVSRNDGTHYFSKTYKEHLQAVRKFQLNSQAREGKSWRDLNKLQKNNH